MDWRNRTEFSRRATLHKGTLSPPALAPASASRVQRVRNSSFHQIRIISKSDCLVFFFVVVSRKPLRRRRILSEDLSGPAESKCADVILKACPTPQRNSFSSCSCSCFCFWGTADSKKTTKVVEPTQRQTQGNPFFQKYIPYLFLLSKI